MKKNGKKGKENVKERNHKYREEKIKWERKGTKGRGESFNLQRKQDRVVVQCRAMQ